MRTAARITGLIWMLICGAAWLYIGLAQPFGRIDQGWWGGWTLPTLLSDSQFGLTMLPLLLGVPGYLLWRWASPRRSEDGASL